MGMSQKATFPSVWSLFLSLKEINLPKEFYYNEMKEKLLHPRCAANFKTSVLGNHLTNHWQITYNPPLQISSHFQKKHLCFSGAQVQCQPISGYGLRRLPLNGI